MYPLFTSFLTGGHWVVFWFGYDKKKAAINIHEHMLPFLLSCVEVMVLIGEEWGLNNWNMETWAASSDNLKPINFDEPLLPVGAALPPLSKESYL